MGCWSGTCAISNLHVRASQRVTVFLLLENKEERSFCYGNALYDLCPIPFYGEYNDYGAVEKCHGFGLDLVVDALRSQLYEFGQGPNEYHDCIVTKKDFNLELLFEADHEDRLGVHNHRNFNQDEYDKRELEQKKEENNGLTPEQNFELDRLINKIKKVDTFRRVTHVIVHGDVFDSIMNKWYIEDYVGSGKGNTGYNNSYVHLYFKDLVDSIPEYIGKMKEKNEEIGKMREELTALKPGVAMTPALHKAFNTVYRSTFTWDDPCLAGRWMEYFKNNSNMSYGLIEASEKVNEYAESKDWDGLAAFVKEALTGAWVNSFMSYTRKVWTKQCGEGSQNQEPLGYKVLAETVLNILEKERKEYSEDEDVEIDQAMEEIK